MMDVLGARVTDAWRAKEIIDSLLTVVKEAKRGVAEMKGMPILAAQPEPEIAPLNDCIVITWEIKNPANPVLIGQAACQAVCHAGVMIAGLIYHCFGAGIPVRGAIGCGDIVTQAETGSIMRLGPGITDVAEWYEQAETIGVIGTPRFGYLLDAIVEHRCRGDRDKISDLFVVYPVKVKRHTEEREMWMASWPGAVLRLSSPGPYLPRARLADYCSDCVIPPEAETKYQHAVRFYDDYKDRYWLKNRGVAMSVRTVLGATPETE
jgi:hypothetical protein